MKARALRDGRRPTRTRYRRRPARAHSRAGFASEPSRIRRRTSTRGRWRPRGRPRRTRRGRRRSRFERERRPLRLRLAVARERPRCAIGVAGTAEAIVLRDSATLAGTPRRRDSRAKRRPVSRALASLRARSELGCLPRRRARSAPSTTRSSNRSDIISSILSSGCNARKRADAGRVARAKAVGRRRAERRSAGPRRAPRSRRRRSRQGFAGARRQRLSDLGVATRRVVRLSSATPSRALQGGDGARHRRLERPNSRAVFEKLPVSAVRANNDNWLNRSFMQR